MGQDNTRSARSLALVILVALVATLVAALGVPAQAAETPGDTSGDTPGITPSDHIWRAGLQIRNYTPYELRLLDTTKTEMTQWDGLAAPRIPPGGIGMSLATNTSTSFGHGVAQFVTYGLYDNDVYRGSIVFAAGVDCEDLFELCYDYHRWQQSWNSDTNLREKVFAEWINNGGPPSNWMTGFELRMVRKGAHPASEEQTDLRHAFAMPDDAPSAVAPGELTSGLFPWSIDMRVRNETPFVLTKVMDWRTQDTKYLQQDQPPARIRVGEEVRFAYGNFATGRGPGMLAMYNATDTNNRYAGTVVFRAATDCNAVIKVPDIPATCAVWDTTGTSVAVGFDAAPLRTFFDSTGVPPISRYVTIGVGVGPPTPPSTTAPPAPTTTAPPQPVDGGLVCAGGVDLREHVDAGDAHVCTTEGAPLPEVRVVDGTLPAGLTLRRYPDAKGSWLVLSGTPTEHGRFPIRVAATTPGHRSEATFDVNVAADLTGEITSYQQGEDGRALLATRGADGAVWFTNASGNSIGRIDSKGSLLNQRTGDGVDRPYDLTAGPGNDMWFTNSGNDSIGRTDGKNFRKYTGEGMSEPHGITTGPDGALWFTNKRNDSIGRLTEAGAVSNYRSAGNIGEPEDIVTGPDGALWFTNIDYAQIGRITTKGQMKFFPTPHPAERITVGPDGALWYTTMGNEVGRMSTDGTVTTFTDKDLTQAAGIVAGPDGALWITNRDGSHPGVLRMTTDGKFTRYFDTNATHTPNSIVVGQDKAIWFTNGATPTIGRIRTSVSSATPVAPDPSMLSAGADSTGSDGADPVEPTTTTIDPGPDARCAVTVENRTGADHDVRVADATKSGGDRWDPKPEADATIAAGSSLGWATVDAAPGACHADARLVLERDGGDDVTWKISVSHGSGEDDRATCTTSDDDYPCEVTPSARADTDALEVLVRLKHRG